ncbi:MAG: NAD(+)/NADH kinase [Planctomycetaceae bacterium]|nr:NAD(+)/NADH kinase [Planctomycetaceae bacterium]
MKNRPGKTKIILFGDPTRPHAIEARERFIAFAGEKIEILSNCFDHTCPSVELLRQADFAVVFGGDGTILGAARQLCETKVPVIGVNVGKLGFLAEFSIEELANEFDRILMGKALIEKRMIIHCMVLREGRIIFSSTAVNDTVITAGPPFNMIEMKLTVQGQPLAVCIGDGIIISTPTGTTAYNLSAGGPILAGNLSAVVITPVCPHSLSFRPIVIDADNRIQIKMVRMNEQTTLLMDGQVHQRLLYGDIVEVQKHPGQFLVVSNPDHTQWSTLADKLNWAKRPRYSEDVM